MVEIRLKSIANRLGKSVSDIARETGLNRNTVTGLFHDKVDGIKFATIDLLCDTYGIRLEDLIVRKETRVGAAPGSRIIRELRMEPPFFSWAPLNALHKPPAHFFQDGVGKSYTFFARGQTERFFDRAELNRFASRTLERYEGDGAMEVHAAFLRARDQLAAAVAGLAAQPVGRFLNADLPKTAQRLSDLRSDMLSTSQWIDAFDCGMRDERVGQVERAHGFTRAETSLLLASGEQTPSVLRRLAVLRLAQANTGVEHRDAKKFLSAYPFVSAEELAADIEAYAKRPETLAFEVETLSRLPKAHADAVRNLLRVKNLRINPLEFFARLDAWRDEREEADRGARFQLDRLLRVIAERSHLAYPLALYLLPQESEGALNGLVGEQALQTRRDEGFLVALEHGGYKAYEGAWAVSVQDDLVSRNMSQLAYANL
ncbi:hypothetical protein A2856_00855 [Candidatus Uhrbacteria bacterium RIFCSPHIGHO2_01_FULL_63_20]|uniref:HTH cro/C1-type domain-containing protein n=1 Tax=Candidatus Uhrbacteria bacterium RIFCSPHIGHO2_01_FULL_63_20 TaxID=1802385 RepID=A0A1F7TM21_9BACT|nr:MAG: hypothetical protein A2856_00855 [Candidatus Uhrbacteria bacterium RIFCSPHIGHO2_01_FULL_63_20]